MIGLDDGPLRLWLAYWRCKQRYHRYSVSGLEHIDSSRALLITGYHAQPVAYDMCMLTVTLHDRLGYLPHGVINGSVEAIAPLKWLCDRLGFFSGDNEQLARAVVRGEHLIITPGAALEGLRGFRDRYRVCWGEHVGYLRLALKHKLRIVPVGAAGSDGAYIGLIDGNALARRLGLPRGAGLWLGVGPFGLYPFSPPFPVRIRQIIGEPIDLTADGEVDIDDRESLLRLHRRVTGAVQGLIDRARGLAHCSASANET